MNSILVWLLGFVVNSSPKGDHPTLNNPKRQTLFFRSLQTNTRVLPPGSEFH
jgi:hypothetical protein